MYRRKTDGWTPLHLATMFGKVDVAKALLRAGADPMLRAELLDLDTVNAEQMARKMGSVNEIPTNLSSRNSIFLVAVSS